MNQIRWFFIAIPVFSLVTGCGKAQSFTAEELQAARHAMLISEVSLMVRSRYDQNKIIAEVQRRHVPATIDGMTEENLVRLGAKPLLIGALKNEANVLTKRQKQAFDELVAKRQATVASDNAAATQDEPQQRKTAGLQETVVVANPETPEERYWKAEAAYRAKKSDLEARIFLEQGRINRLRSSGAHESDLASAEARLHHYEDELKNLQSPMR